MKNLTLIPAHPGFFLSRFCLVYDTEGGLVPSFKDPKNYYLTSVRLGETVVELHFIVASVFVPNPLSLPFVGFVRDGIYLPSNLFWSAERYIPRNRRGALSWAMVNEIRESTLPRKEIAKKFGVSNDYVGKIIRGEVWRF